MAGAAARTLSNAEIEGELRAFAAGDPRILAVYLFGSRGRREETEQSDVDVGVLFRQQESLREVLLLEDALERRLGLSSTSFAASGSSAPSRTAATSSSST